MSTYNKELGKLWEKIAAQYYQKNWYQILHTNYTAKWYGELDVVASKDNLIAFIEVKTVNHTENLDCYITRNKIKNLIRTIDHYLYHYPTTKLIRLDVAFVKDNNILEIYENITNN